MSEADGPMSGAAGDSAPSRATPIARNTRAELDRQRGRTEPGESASGSESSVLEARYRRLLRLLPRGYRDLREEEMVATFLAAMRDADPENVDLTLRHGRPSGAEMRAVAALAVRARWGESVAPERFAARALAWRLVLFTGVTMMWVFAVAQLIGVGIALAFDRVAVDSSAITDIYREVFALPPGSWAWWSTWAYVGWAVALPLLVFGGRAGARWAAACAAVPVVVMVIGWARDGVTSGIHIADIPGLAVNVALICLLVAFAVQPDVHDRALPADAIRQSLAPRRGVFLIAGIGLVGVLVAYTAAIWLWPDLWRAPCAAATLAQSMGWLISFDAGRWTLAAAICAFSMLVGRRHPVDPVRAAAMAIGCAGVAGVATILSAALASESSPAGFNTSMFAWTLVTNAVQMASAAGIFVISTVVAARRLRALPRGR